MTLSEQEQESELQDALKLSAENVDALPQPVPVPVHRQPSPVMHGGNLTNLMDNNSEFGGSQGHGHGQRQHGDTVGGGRESSDVDSEGEALEAFSPHTMHLQAGMGDGF